MRLWLAVALVLLASDGLSAQGGTPRLVVVLVVDQFRASELDRYARQWRGGFRRLLDEGAYFTRAEYPYLNTVTCAGHSTISTGTVPRTHGIVLNRWWDRTEQRVVSCTDDPASPHVSYGAAAAGGNSARHIRVPTFAEVLRSAQPGARVVSLALKPRSAIALAGNGSGVVTWFDEASRSFVTSRAFSPEPVPSVREFLARQPLEAAAGEVWALLNDARTYRHEDLIPTERPKTGWTALFPHALGGAGGADAEFYDRWQKSPWSDAYLGRMAAAVSDDLRLGRGEATDYLAISFSALDLLGHDFGSDSREAEDLLLRLDATIGTLLEHLDRTIGGERYVVALTSDHGIAPIPEQVRGGRIASEDIHQALEQTIAAQWGPRAGAPYVAWVGPGSVYFAEGVYGRLRGDAPALARVLDTLLAVPGIGRVLRTDMLTASDSDRALKAAAAGYLAERSGDLLIVPERHWIFELRNEWDATNHGTLHDYDRHVPVLLRGARIRPGRYREPATPADIAPTLAYLTGLDLTGADGRVLREAVR